MDELDLGGQSMGINVIFQYTSTGVQIFTGSIFYIIIAHLFSTSNVGAITLFVAILSFFSILFQLGLSTASQHFTSYNIGKGNYAVARNTIYKILTFTILLSALASSSLIALAPRISEFFLHSYSFVFLVRILGVVLFGNIIFSVLNGILLGMQNFRSSAIINVIIWILYYLGAVLLAFFFRSVNIIILAWFIGIFVGVIIELTIVLLSLRKFYGKGKSLPSIFIFSYSLPLMLSGIIYYGASSVDRFIVSGILNLSSLGIYNFSLLIAGSLSFVAVPFNNILMPKFSEYYGRGLNNDISNITKVSSTLLSIIYVPLALGVAALGPMILNLIGGGNYVAGSTALEIILFITSLVISQNVFAQALAAVRMTKIFIYSGAISLLLNMGLSIALIPRLGLPGAAIGFSSVYVSLFLIYFYFGKKNRILDFDIMGQVKIWLASGIMYIIVYLSKEAFGESLIHIPFYVCLGAIIYLLFVRSLKIFKNEDKHLVLSVFPEDFKRLRKILYMFILQ